MISTLSTELAKEFIPKQERKVQADEHHRVLEKVLNFQFDQCTDLFTPDHFIHHLYDREIFLKTRKELVENLPVYDYHYVHSYAKNGKSTFINTFIHGYKKKSRNRVFKLDFSQISSNQSLNIESRIRNLLYENFKYYLSKYKHCDYNKHPFVSLFKYVNDSGNQSESYKEYPNLRIFNFIDKLKLNYAEELIVASEYLKEYASGDFRFKNEHFVEKLFYQKSFETHELFNLFITLLAYAYSKESSVDNLLLVCDNLDDVYTYLPEDFSVSYVSHVTQFHSALINSFNNIFKNSENEELEVKFIFAYRTSNFLSTINIQLSIPDTQVERLNFFTATSKKYRLSSVKQSFDIINKRLLFYEKLCKSGNIEISSKYELLKQFILTFEVFDKKKIHGFDIDKVLRLWNGNKMSFVKFLIEAKFSENEITIINKPTAEINAQIKAGLFYNKFVKYYSQIYDQGPQRTFIKYSFGHFKNDHDMGRCSLSRLFFTYIYNERKKDPGVNSIRDSFSKGIKLRSFITDINKIGDSDEFIYSKDDLKEMFQALFSHEIDHWGNFFSCCSATEISERTSRETYKFVDDLLKNIDLKEAEDGVKFFYNDAAPYFMFQLKRSYEYFSYSTNSTNGSIMTQLSISLLKDGTYVTGFENSLKMVYDRVKMCTQVTTDFFINKFNNTSLKDYCKSSWAFNEKFYFDDLISKIIGYLEEVRYAVLNDCLVIDGEYERYDREGKIECKKIINSIFSNNIHAYLGLFRVILSRLEEYDEDLPDSLKRTKVSFGKLENKYLSIKGSYYLDFQTRITT